MSVSTNSIVFTDCHAVWTGITRLQKEGWSELRWLSSPDLELWRAAWNILSYPSRKLQAVWIGAHRSMSEARGSEDAWRIYHNAKTDRCASVAMNPFPGPIQEIYQRLIVQNRELETKRDQIVFYLKTIWSMHSSKEAPSSSAV